MAGNRRAGNAGDVLLWIFSEGLPAALAITTLPTGWAYQDVRMNIRRNSECQPLVATVLVARINGRFSTNRTSGETTTAR